MPHISEREIELPDAVIGKMLKIATENKDIVSLGPGEPDFATPKPIVDYVKKIAAESNHYAPPDGRRDLREAIVKKLKKDNKINADPENVIVTAGSQEALMLATACGLDVSEQILIPDPGFLGYTPMVELFDVVPVGVPLLEENNFEFNPDDVRQAIDKKKTKAIILNTPGNPTGAVFSKKILEELADIAVEHDLYIFSDEAYEKIIYENKHISIGSFNGMEEYVATFHSFSKTYAMAGYRIGYCAGPSKLLTAMKKTHIYSTIAAPTISQRAAWKALSLPQGMIKPMVASYKKRRDLLVRRLNDMGLRTPLPGGAFYTFSYIGKQNSFAFAERALKEAKVAVIPGAEFGKHGEHYIRCSYATDIKKISEAADRLEKWLNK